MFSLGVFSQGGPSSITADQFLLGDSDGLVVGSVVGAVGLREGIAVRRSLPHFQQYCHANFVKACLHASFSGGKLDAESALEKQLL